MILDGKKIKEDILNELKSKTESLNLSLAVIQIGEDEASTVYIKQKRKMCESLNIEFKHYQFAEDSSEEEILNQIDDLNKNSTTGILLQLPIPDKFNQTMLQNRIHYLKDVDGLNDINVAKLINKKESIMPCTARGIIEILKRNNINIVGKNAVIVGRSNLVGRPVANLLINENATVTVCHSMTNNLKEYTKEADILVVATGVKHLITADMIKDGTVIIDVGINRVDNKLYGDVDFENIKDKASFITPVPGGVGPVTVAMLAQNIYEAYLIQTKKL